MQTQIYDRKTKTVNTRELQAFLDQAADLAGADRQRHLNETRATLAELAVA